MKRACLISLVTLLLFGVSPIHAQPAKNGIEVTPAFVEVNLESPLGEEQVEIFYTNHTKEFISLQIFPMNFRQKNEYGALSFAGQEPGSYSYSLASFLTFDSQTLELAPGEKKPLLVTVKNRKDLSPGGHYAAVVAKLSVESSDPEASRVAPSVSSLILVRKVGGERFHMSLKEVDFPQGMFSLRYPGSMTLLFQNQGNIHLVPYGRIEIKDMFGRLVYDGSINPSSIRVFPSSRRYIDTALTKIRTPLPLSFNTVSIRGYDSLRKTTFIHEESFIYMHPLLLIGIIGGMGFYFWRKRKSAKERNDQERKAKRNLFLKPAVERQIPSNRSQKIILVQEQSKSKRKKQVRPAKTARSHREKK